MLISLNFYHQPCLLEIKIKTIENVKKANKKFLTCLKILKNKSSIKTTKFK